MASEIAAALRIQCPQQQSEKLTLRPLMGATSYSSMNGRLPSMDPPSAQPAPSQPPGHRRGDAEHGWEGKSCVSSWDCDTAAALEASHWFVS
jgi:hypothetical protein